MNEQLERKELVELMGQLARILSDRTSLPKDRRYQKAAQLCRTHADRWGLDADEFEAACLNEFVRELLAA